MVYRTTVKDGDGDGLLDRLETAGQYPISDPYGRPLPNLPAMGATPTVKDVFIETGYFDSDFDNNGTLDDLFYGDPTNLANKRNAHTHLPPPESLKLMGDAFALKGIKVHFDMGPNYAAAWTLRICRSLRGPRGRGPWRRSDVGVDHGVRADA